MYGTLMKRSYAISSCIIDQGKDISCGKNSYPSDLLSEKCSLTEIIINEQFLARIILDLDTLLILIKINIRISRWI